MPASRLIERLNQGRWTDLVLVLLCIFAGGPFFGVIVFGLMLAGYASFQGIGLTSQQNWSKLIALSLVIAIGIQLISKGLINPAMDLVFGPTTTTLYDAASESLAGYLFWIAFGVVFTAFFEEFTYRGFILNYLDRALARYRYHVAASLLLTSIVFGLGHYFSQGVRGILPATLLGLLFGLTYLRFGRNLWMAVFTHGWFNFISFTLDYVGES